MSELPRPDHARNMRFVGYSAGQGRRRPRLDRRARGDSVILRREATKSPSLEG